MVADSLRLPGPGVTHGAVDVSVVIAGLEQGAFLVRSIRSALAQTFPGRFHEVVVADAGSTDFSREIMSAYGDRIVPVLLDAGSTLGQALWAGIRRACGRYVVPMRAQDFISDYTILFQAIWLFQNGSFDGVRVDYFLVEPGSDTKAERISAAERPAHTGTMFRKEVFAQEGLYRPVEPEPSPETICRRLESSRRVGHIPIPFYRYQKGSSDGA